MPVFDVAELEILLADGLPADPWTRLGTSDWYLIPSAGLLVKHPLTDGLPAHLQELIDRFRMEESSNAGA